MYYLITELNFYFPCNLIKKITCIHFVHEMYCATKRLPFPVDVVSLVGIVAIGVGPAALVLSAAVDDKQFTAG